MSMRQSRGRLGRALDVLLGLAITSAITGTLYFDSDIPKQLSNEEKKYDLNGNGRLEYNERQAYEKKDN